MWNILREMVSYAFFLWIVLILSYGNRDPNAFYMQKSLRDAFIHDGAFDGTDYNLVSDASKFWYYLHHGFLSDLRADVMYNDKPAFGLRGFFGDQCNRIMGFAIIRQIRTEQNTCRVAKIMENVTNQCASFTHIYDEEEEDYCTHWRRPTEETKDSEDCKMEEFKYSTAKSLDSYPIIGNLDKYAGGGYVIKISGPTSELLEKFTKLQKLQWIDGKTRAVIIEFSSYNSQVNLFGTSTIIAEFNPGGGIFPYYRFDGIRLLRHHDNFGMFVLICELTFVLFLIYFTVREIRSFWKLRRRYFDSYWSYAEISIIGVGYASVVIYIYRYVTTNEVLDIFNSTWGNGYVKIQYAAYLDELFGYMVGFITFVGTIKFSKLLRFNRRIGILSATLHHCWDELSGFLFAFFIAFFSFVFCFYLSLNSSLRSFYNFVSAVETSFSMMLGKFNFDEMRETSFIMPIMFFIFVLFNSWVLINLLLTLIMGAFEEVKNNLLHQPNEYEMVDFVWRRVRGFLGIRPKKQMDHPEQKIQDELEKQEAEAHLRHNSASKGQSEVKELPLKIDKFMDYVNSYYFNGTLDLQNREAFKKEMRVYKSD